MPLLALKSSLALALMSLGAACSLLAPARDELGGGVGPSKGGAAGAGAQTSGGNSAGGDTTQGGSNGGRPDDGAGSGGKSGAGASAGSAGEGGAPPLNVLDCGSTNNGAQPGVWVNITPPDVTVYESGVASSDTRGTHHIVLDPQNAGILYAGTRNEGLYKSTDCGGTWVLISTGRNGLQVGAAAQWQLTIDPVDTQILYAPGEKFSNAIYKSTNGGVDWDKIWPPADPDLSSVVEGNNMGVLELDPNDHEHLVLPARSPCHGAQTPVCWAESSDGGANFEFHDGKPAWVAQPLRLSLVDSTTWLGDAGSNGFFYSTDAGATWHDITTGLDGVFGSLYRATDGLMYFGTNQGVLHSVTSEVDGGWQLSPNSGEGVRAGVIGDGTSLYVSDFGYCMNWAGHDLRIYRSSNEDDGKTWRYLAAPGMWQGAVSLGYDSAHGFLYSSNCGAGLWRVKVPVPVQP